MAYERQMDYIDVATRLHEMRDVFPDLTMQQVSMEFVTVAGGSYVVYVAAAYRNSDDPRPGIGTACCNACAGRPNNQVLIGAYIPQAIRP